MWEDNVKPVQQESLKNEDISALAETPYSLPLGAGIISSILHGDEQIF